MIQILFNILLIAKLSFYFLLNETQKILAYKISRGKLRDLEFVE